MTVRTIANGPFPGKLAFMVIGMTGGASVVGQGIEEALGVTIPAVDLLVLAQQGKLGEAVVELVQVLDRGE